MKHTPVLAFLVLFVATAAAAQAGAKSLLLRLQSSVAFLEGDQLVSEILVFRDGLVIRKEARGGLAGYSRSLAQPRELAALRHALAAGSIGSLDGVSCTTAFRPPFLHVERFDETVTWFGADSRQSRFRASGIPSTECSAAIEDLLVAFQRFLEALRDNPGNEGVFTEP